MISHNTNKYDKMSEELLLKWNEHHNLFFVGAEELCESEEYTDVTLAAGTKFFPAHKLVLSICSPYFKQLFKHLGKEKSVIFLKDVDPSHLDLLLQYMYKGEIKVQVGGRNQPFLLRSDRIWFVSGK